MIVRLSIVGTLLVVLCGCAKLGWGEANGDAAASDAASDAAGESSTAAPDGAAVDAVRGLEVTVSGIDGELAENVATLLRINRLADSSDRPLPSEARLRWLHRQAEDDIRQALAPFGYYRPRVSGELNALPDDRWQAVYQIDPGPPLPVAGIDIRLSGEGRDDAPFQRLLEQPPFAAGDRLRHPLYEDFKQRLIGLATERGYFDARFERSQIRVDLDAYRADIVLHYDTGERYTFGEVNYLQDALAPEFLQRYVDFDSGDPYYAPTLLKLQSDLINSGYFSTVSVSAPLDRAEGRVLPVLVEAEPRKSRSYSAGLGYGTDTGVRLRGGVDERRVNRWGHRYEVQALVSQIEYSVAGKYSIPGDNPRTDSLSARASASFQDSDVKESLTASAGVTSQRQDGAWLKINSLDYQWEQFTFGDEEEITRLLIAGSNWSRIDRTPRSVKDDPGADPDSFVYSDGTRFGFEVRGALEYLLSDISFAQAIVRSKWIRSFGADDRLILRGDAGATYVADDDFDQLPSSLRFFAGGDNSVRGYSLDSIGPLDDDDVIGGRYMVVGSVEFEHRVYDKWSVAGFIDAGDAFDDAPELRTGVGVGVRWQSPVGPVRVDVASGLDDPGDVVRLHVSIGPDL